MRWQGQRESSNVEDARGRGGIGGGKLIGGGIGVILVIVISLLTGKNPMALLSQLQDSSSGTTQQCSSESMNQESAKFVRVILASTEDVWTGLFRDMGKEYQLPTLQLFCGTTESACGMGSSAMGPFYCPGDHKAYIDLAFYEELQTRFKAPGDFAMAYVVAHEIGHHIQNILGISGKIHQMQQGLDKTAANRLSVALELQADFLAGVWAHHAQKTKNWLQEGDLEEALNAANAIGDDKLQQESQGYVVPDAFTHGTSEQRIYWFKKGFETGDMNQGDTFRDPM